MTDQPLITIIVPVYNTEKYLPDCLDSLINQTEKNIEILAVDDGSVDSSPQILRRYAELCPNLKVFKQKNAGPGVARNTALAKATGKYIMFCDSDDMFKPDMCKTMAQIMEDKKVDFAFCDTEEFESDVQKSHIGKSGFLDVSPQSFPNIGVGVWCFIFRREILKKYNIVFPPCFYAEDFAFAMEYVFISRSAYALDKKLYILRSRDDSLMHSLSIGKYNPKITDNLDAMQDMYNFLKKYGLLNVYQKRYLKIVEKLTIGCFRFIADQKQNEAFLQLQKILKPFCGSMDDFKLLSLAASGQKKAFLNYLNTCNMSGTSKRKIWGITFFKTKNRINERIYYVLNLPVLKVVLTNRKPRRYIFGVRVS